MCAKVAVLGSGAWGTTLAKLLVEQGHQVRLWSFEEEVAVEINTAHRNLSYLSGVDLPPSLISSTQLSEILPGSEAVISTVIARGLRDVLAIIRDGDLWPQDAPGLTATKGLEPETNLRMTEVIAAELNLPPDQLAVLSGPNHAPEIAKHALAGAVVAAEQRQVAEYFQQLLMCSYFRIYTSPDVIGVELGGALKNVIAIAAGICDGMNLGDNTKAALVTRGLAEMTRLGTCLGAEALTFAGLSGIGDLMVTCNSRLSRNRGCGEQIGSGKSYQQIFAESRSVIEGARTAVAVHELAARLGLEMPISEAVYEILYNEQPLKETIDRLMQRIAKPEDEGQALRRWYIS